MTSRPPTPRHLGPYSPRHPSPLGFPPLAPHVAFHQATYAWPTTPDRVVQPKGPSSIRVPFPPEARRPLAGSTRRRMSQPLPPPLDLGSKQNLPPPPKTGNVLLVPGQELLKPPLSPTPSEASSLSMYSAESIKDFPIEVVVPEQMQQQQEEERKPSKNPLCGCFASIFSSKSRQKEIENRILGPPQRTVQPAPVPQMTQVVKKRPSPLNL